MFLPTHYHLKLLVSCHCGHHRNVSMNEAMPPKRTCYVEMADGVVPVLDLERHQTS